MITEEKEEIRDDSDTLKGAHEYRRRKSSFIAVSTEQGKFEMPVGHPAAMTIHTTYMPGHLSTLYALIYLSSQRP